MSKSEQITELENMIEAFKIQIIDLNDEIDYLTNEINDCIKLIRELNK